MKKNKLLYVIILLFLSTYCFSQKARIEFQPYAGFVYEKGFGVQMGGDVSFPVTSYFCIQSGLLFSNDRSIEYRNPKWKIAINIPVFASFRLPVSEHLKVRMNVGPYGGIASVGQFGCAVGVGLEIENLYVGTTYYQNCITNKNYQIGLLAGYRFLF